MFTKGHQKNTIIVTIHNCVILAFNSKIDTDYKSDIVKIISSNIIYKLIDDYQDFIKEQIKKEEEAKLNSLTLPAKLEFLPQCTFRQSNPAVIGVEILEGTLKTGVNLFSIKTRKIIGVVKGIQKNKMKVISVS